MESNVQQTEKQTSIKTESGPLAKPLMDQPWMEYVQPVWDTIAKVPDYLGDFFVDNKKPLITIGLFIGGIVTVKITLAVLDALDDIPLLAPILELVGLGYSVWFVYRYLLKESSRQELITEFAALKTQVFGDSPQDS